MFGLPEGEDLNWFGQLFLLAAYGFILFKAAVLIGDGSEKLLLLYGPGIIGGLIIPVLGAVPDGAIVLVSGLGPDAQKQISVGVGTLAGSTIMLLTLPWAGAVLLGRRDYDPTTQRAAVKPGTNKPKCEEPLSWTGSCVTTYDSVPLGAKIMMVTAASYLIVAIPAAINKGSPNAAQDEQLPALVGLIVCAVVFLVYGAYQVYDSNAATDQQMQQNRVKFQKWKNAINQHFGSLNAAAEVLFEKFDKDGNGFISVEELYEGLASLDLECSRKEVFDIMKKMNTDDDDTTLTLSEFREALKRWAKNFTPGVASKNKLQKKQKELNSNLQHKKRGGSVPPPRTIPETGTIDDNDNDDNKEEQAAADDADSAPAQSGGDVTVAVDDNTNVDATGSTEKTDLLPVAGSTYQSTVGSDTVVYSRSDIEQKLAEKWKENEEDDDEELELDRTDGQILMEALGMLFGGTLLCVVFSDPMVAVISNFSDTIQIPAFFISFILTPLASNAAEIYSTLVFAKKKTTEGVSLGFSALYGAACMNNSFCLCIFCILIYTQQLKWTFMVETLVILLTIIVVGIIGLNSTVFVWQAAIVASMFPLSLLLVAVLDKPLDD